MSTEENTAPPADAAATAATAAAAVAEAAAEAAEAAKEFTYAEVAQTKDNKQMYTVIHDKVYNLTKFADEHPGGEEVLLDVVGQDSTEAFEDVGHSDEAREILKDLLVGNLKRLPTDPRPKVAPPPSASSSTGSSSNRKGDISSIGIYMYAAFAVIGAVVYMMMKGKDSTGASTDA
ncbi:hypothetical protein KEM54_001184 [Ascosphaera aggregata]|nr:hypothetical protein KEM54_001184 [Ascosphaera aggregata]